MSVVTIGACACCGWDCKPASFEFVSFELTLTWTYSTTKANGKTYYWYTGNPDYSAPIDTCTLKITNTSNVAKVLTREQIKSLGGDAWSTGPFPMAWDDRYPPIDPNKAGPFTEFRLRLCNKNLYTRLYFPAIHYEGAVTFTLDDVVTFG